MKVKPTFVFLAFVLIASRVVAQEQTLEQSLAETAKKLAAQVKERDKKKVAVLDFTDLQGGSSELGKYVAEQLTINLVMEKREFAVLDRANLRRVLSEHKLTATGLIDPENAKKLGQFAGVDALIFGNLVTLSQNVEFTAKIITTDTAEIVGATRSKFKIDEIVKELVSHPTTGRAPEGGDGILDDGPKVTKTFGDLKVDLPPLKIVNDSQYLLSMTLSNKNSRRSIWVALNDDMSSTPKSVLRNAEGYEFYTSFRVISGIVDSAEQYGQFFKATEIPAGESITATVKFESRGGRRPTVDPCNLQMELLTATAFDGRSGKCEVRNLTTVLKVAEAK